MPQRKLNHAGVDIYIPDDKKFEAILTVDGEEVKVGRKEFDTVDDFLSWLEGKATEIKHHQRLAKDGETRTRVAAREIKDAETAVDKLKRSDFDTLEEFVEATRRAGTKLERALLDGRGADDTLRTHSRTLEGLKETLGAVEVKGK